MTSEIDNIGTNYLSVYWKLYIIYILFRTYMRKEWDYMRKISYCQETKQIFQAGVIHTSTSSLCSSPAPPSKAVWQLCSRTSVPGTQSQAASSYGHIWNVYAHRANTPITHYQSIYYIHCATNLIILFFLVYNEVKNKSTFVRRGRLQL